MTLQNSKTTLTSKLSYIKIIKRMNKYSNNVINIDNDIDIKSLGDVMLWRKQKGK